jgi:hypothetical protein
VLQNGGMYIHYVGYLKNMVLYTGNIKKKCILVLTSGFQLGIIETFALLGYYGSLIVSYHQFGKTYWYHLQCSNSQLDHCFPVGWIDP